jgi:hypothetical protein
MRAETSSTLFAATILFLIAIMLALIGVRDIWFDEDSKPPLPKDQSPVAQVEAVSAPDEAGRIVRSSRFYGTGQHWHVLTEYETKSGRAIWCINQGGELSCVTHR